MVRNNTRMADSTTTILCMKSALLTIGLLALIFPRDRLKQNCYYLGINKKCITQINVHTTLNQEKGRSRIVLKSFCDIHNSLLILVFFSLHFLLYNNKNTGRTCVCAKQAIVFLQERNENQFETAFKNIALQYEIHTY